MHAGFEGVARFQHALARQGQPHLGQPVKEAMGTLTRRAPVTRPGDHSDVAVAEREQVARCCCRAIAIVGDHRLHVFFRRMRVDPHVAAVDVVQHLRECNRFGCTRAEDHPMQLLLLHEAAHALRALRVLAVAGMHTSS